MRHSKIISILLIHILIGAGNLSAGTSSDKSSAKSRIDSYDEILRPPPPPPPHPGNIRVQHFSPGQQRFQRQPRQPFQGSHQSHVRYPVKNNEPPSFFQKISSWFMGTKPNTEYGPPPGYGTPPVYGPPNQSGPPVYGPPNQGPPSNYGPPINHDPPSSYGPPVNHGPSPSYGPPVHLGPPSKHHSPPNNGPLPSEFRPPNNGPPPDHIGLNNNGPPSSNYGPPDSGPGSGNFIHNNDLHPSYGPPINNAPRPSYGPPDKQINFGSSINSGFQSNSNHGGSPNLNPSPPLRLQHQRQIPKKNCNPCNYYPWIPVLTYQNGKSKQPSIDSQSNLGENVQSNYANLNNEYLPSKLSLPTEESHGDHFLSNSNNLINNGIPSPPTTASGKPFSISQIDLEDNYPSFGAGLSRPLTNSYGTPIPSNTYGSPYPETNDGSDLLVLGNEKTPQTIIKNENSENQYNSKENLEHLETNNILQVSKPSSSSTTVKIETQKPIKDSDESNSQHDNNRDNFVRSVFPNQNSGVQVLQPIPFPNLSPIPVPPIFNARPFRNNFESNFKNHGNENPNYFTKVNNDIYNKNTLQGSPSSENNYQGNNNIQLVPSIPVAEFSSSIEYPISIIQSPLVEIDASHSSNHNENKFNENENHFKSNPIVVENETNKPNYDSHSAASGGNDHESDQNVNLYDDNDDVDSSVDDYNDAKPQFLPTPTTYEINTQHNISNNLINSHNEQTYSKTIVSTTPFPIKFNTISPKFEENTSINPFRPAEPAILQSLDSPLLYLRPNVPHKNSDNFLEISNKPEPFSKNKANDFASSTNVVASTVTTIPTKVIPLWNNNAFRYIDNTASVPGRWPPLLSNFDEDNNLTKKPKRIQIIIPYTSQNHPSPFKFSNNDIASTSGWIPMTDEIGANHGRKVPSLSSQEGTHIPYKSNSVVDYHESAESKIVSSSSPSFNTTVSHLPKYPDTTTYFAFTTDQPIKVENKPSFDVMKLQKNIDDWTVQEFSKIYNRRQQKSSTTSHLKRSKKIPDEYFTTTPSISTDKAIFSTINDLNLSFLDNEVADSFQHSVETDLGKEKSVDNINNEISYESSVSITSRPTYYTSTYYPTTFSYADFTTVTPKTTTRHAWDRILTSISPLTKERVYVVTPQPWNLENKETKNDEKRDANNEIDSSSNITKTVPSLPGTSFKKRDELNQLSFKSPRFLVRPTPGPTGSQKDNSAKSRNEHIPISGLDWLKSINELIDTTTTESASKSFFGLSAVTAYTPPDGAAVHTFSGHSKVATVATPTLETNTNTKNYF